MNKHRESVYRLRREVTFTDSAEDKVEDFIEEYVESLIDFHTQGSNYEWNIKEIEESIKALTNYELRITNYEAKVQEEFKKEVLEFVYQKYEEKEKEIGEEQMRQLERIVLLRTIDELWMDHIEAMEYLRDSVRLRAYGQRDPLVEYKIEGQKMFHQLMSSIGSQVANIIFKVSLMKQPTQVKVQERRPDIVKESHSHQQNINEPVRREPVKDNEPKIGRNDPCWCGSKKKYKKCHGS